MTEPTDALIERLARGLEPVRRLPRLRRVAAGVGGLALALLGLELAPAWLGSAPLVKPGFGAADTFTLAAHALLFAGALCVALAACVPGRESLARLGAIPLGVALAGVVSIGAVRLYWWQESAALAPDWLAATLRCSLDSVLPAALPLLLFTRFAARAAPRRVALVLLLAGAASLGLLALPGVVGCAYPDQLHQALGHTATPALGALALLVVALPIWLGLRRFTSA